MGNLYQKKEDNQEFKEPKLATEKLDIPSDTRENMEKEESKEIKEELEKQNENEEEENPQEEIKQEEDSHKEEQNEEQEINEEKMIEENQNEVIKTPIKEKIKNFNQNGNLLQVNDDKDQIYKSASEPQESSLAQNQIVRPIQKENQGTNESYEINQEKNTNNENNIIYHNIAFRANQKINNNDQNVQYIKKQESRRSKASSKKKEPKDSNPKIHILSKTKRGNQKYTKTNIQISSEFVDIPRNEYDKEIANKEFSMVLGEGMDTGEYKFIGEKTLIKENIVPNENVKIDQEEVKAELIKRKNKKKAKKMKYEVIDKFYALTNITQKTIKKVEKNDIKPGDKNYFYSTLNTSNININNNINNPFKGFNPQGNFPQIGNMNFPLQYSPFNINNMNLNNLNNMNISMPLDNYSRYFLSQINKIRTEPQSFIGVIEDSKSNIIRDRYGRIIYNGKIKVVLNSGETAFDEAIKFLKESSPVEPLIYNQMLTVNSPMTEEEILDKNDLIKKVETMTQMGVNIRSFWRDVIKDPEISFLLMIIDDNGIKSGMRRKDILSPYMKYIGISSTEIKNNFVCYITLA